MKMSSQSLMLPTMASTNAAAKLFQISKPKKAFFGSWFSSRTVGVVMIFLELHTLFEHGQV